MKKLALIILILSLLCSVLLVSCNNTDDDYDKDEEENEKENDKANEKEYEDPEKIYEYEEISGGLSLTKYKGNKTVITVPSIIGNKKVVSTGTAFSGNVVIEEISLPSSVIYADLSGCINLVSVKAPGIKDEDYIDLTDCTSLKYLELNGMTRFFYDIPNSVEILRLDNANGQLDVCSIKGGAQLKTLIIPKIKIIYKGYDSWPCKLESVTVSKYMKYYNQAPDYDLDYYISAINCSSGDFITGEKAAYVYCEFFRVNEITVNGVLYEK